MNTLQLTILQASDGCKLLNKNNKALASYVQLAPKASADDWEEITDAEAESLQAEWIAAIEAEQNAATSEATPTE